MTDKTLKIAFIKARWHSDIVDQALVGFEQDMAASGVPYHITTFDVPGAFEMPLLAKKLGKSGKFPDGAAIDWILDQPQAADFIVGKLYREFVCDEPPPDPQLLQPLAEEFREHNMQIAPIVRRILTSRLFYSAHARARKIR